MIPDWVLQALDVAHYDTVQYEQKTGEAWSDHSMSAQSFVEGRVCRSCNGGWMSDLERAVRPTLEYLWNTADAIPDVTPEHRSVLARWAAKTGYMVLSASPYGYAVPQDHRTILAPPIEGLAQGVVVCAADHTPQDPIPVPTEVGWRQEQSWRMADATPPALRRRLDDGNLASYKVTLRLRRLMLTVGYWPDAAWRIERWREVHHQIAPEAPYIVARDLGLLPQEISQQVIVEVHRNLGLRRR